jgi:hypothetical protein
MELRLDPLSSSFNPYFSVIIGKTNKARLMLTWSSNKYLFNDLRQIFKATFVSSQDFIIFWLNYPLQDV